MIVRNPIFATERWYDVEDLSPSVDDPEPYQLEMLAPDLASLSTKTVVTGTGTAFSSKCKHLIRPNATSPVAKVFLWVVGHRCAIHFDSPVL